MINDHYRQGDVLLVKVAKLPEGCEKERYKERIVLAYGEVTGHAHAISPAAASYFIYENTNYLQVDQPTNLVHEEHDAIAVEPGIYKVVRQREYDPLRDRIVKD